MLSAEEAQSHGKTVNKLIESLLGCDDSALTVETTMELLNSMKILVSGAPAAVKERVQLVLSRLVSLTTTTTDKRETVEVVKSIGAVSETLVNWYINKKLRQDSGTATTAPGGSDEVPVEELQVVKKFSNFLTRRNPRLYLPTLCNPEMVLEMSYVLFCKTYQSITQCKHDSYTKQSDLVIQIMLSVSSLLDIEDRIFVNRFPYRAQVFSFTEKLVRKFREDKTVVEPSPRVAMETSPRVAMETDRHSLTGLLRSLSDVLLEMVEACRERLTGDISLKRAQSMALRPGGPLPKCLFSVKHHTRPLGVMAVKLVFSVRDDSLQKDEFELETMSLASIKCITKQIGVKLRIDPEFIVLSSESGEIPQSSLVRAGDLVNKQLFLYTSSLKHEERNKKPNVLEDALKKSFARAIYDFEVDDSKHLSFIKGDIVQVTNKHQDGWWNGRLEAKTGSFPANLVQELSENEMLTMVCTLNGLTSYPEDKENVVKPLQTAHTTPKKTPKRTPNFPTPEPKTPRQKGRYVKPTEGWTLTPSSKNYAKIKKLPDSLKEGLLKKESSGGKFWNSRYFVLHKDRIVYYKSIEARPPPAGIVCFSDVAFAAVSTKNTGPCFTLQGKSGKRSYHLMGRSRDDMDQWIQSINQALRLDIRSSPGGGGTEGTGYGKRSRKVSYESSVRLTTASTCLDYLLSDSRYKNKNLLRVSGNEREVKQCLKLLDRGQIPEIELIPSPHTVVGLLKLVLRKIDDRMVSLIPANISSDILSLISKLDHQVLEKHGDEDMTPLKHEVSVDIQLQLQKLDRDRMEVFDSLIRFFRLVLSNTCENSVTLVDISRTFGVLILESLDVCSSSKVLQFIINHS